MFFDRGNVNILAQLVLITLEESQRDSSIGNNFVDEIIVLVDDRVANSGLIVIFAGQIEY